MIAFEFSMDKDRLHVKRDGMRIGYIQRHTDRDPRFVGIEAFTELSLTELNEVVAELKSFVAEKRR